MAFLGEEDGGLSFSRQKIGIPRTKSLASSRDGVRPVPCASEEENRRRAARGWRT